MKKNSFIALLMICLIVGCMPPAMSTPSPVVTQTPLPLPTLTAAPTATQPSALPTVTSEPALRTEGPYFTYFRKVNETYQLVMMDADGEGRKVVQLPQEVIDSFPNKEYDLDMKLVSPEGHWLAFYTGYVGNSYEQELATEEHDLTLNLLDLNTGDKRVVTPLLSHDYPRNFAQASESLNDPLLTPETLHHAFLYGIARSIAWSPDGKYLAFAAQIDGLSSDLYVYDTNMQTVLRLTDGLGELQWIQWSPDSKSILHGSTYMISMGSTFDVYSVKLDGSPARYLTTTSSISFKEWLDSHAYFEYEAANVVKKYGLRLVNVDTGQITEIWHDPFETFAVNGSREWLVLIMQAHSFDGEQPDAYLINLKTLERMKLEVPYGDQSVYDVQPLDLDKRLFAVVGMRTGMESYFVSNAGSLLPIEGENLLKISISPDSNYWVAASSQSVKTWSKDNVLIHDLAYPTDGVYPHAVVWRPDSSGFFIVSATKLFSVNVLDGKLMLVEQYMENYFNNYQYSWIGK